MEQQENLPSSFDDLLKTHDKPILVDFWAEWCGPCRMVSPEVAKLAKEWKDKVTVIKINTDEKQNIAMKHGISSIPTLILFKQGKEAKRISGAMSSEQIKKIFEPFV
jgi:thioredoxin 1